MPAAWWRILAAIDMDRRQGDSLAPGSPLPLPALQLLEQLQLFMTATQVV